MREAARTTRCCTLAVATGEPSWNTTRATLTIPSSRGVQAHFGALRVDVAGRAARFRYQTVEGRVRDEFRVSCS